MRADDGLILIRIVQTLDIVEVGDIKGGDVAADGDGKVGPLAVVRNVRVDGGGLLGLVAELVQDLGNTLLAVLVLAVRVDDPDLTGANSTGSRGSV